LVARTACTIAVALRMNSVGLLDFLAITLGDLIASRITFVQMRQELGVDDGLHFARMAVSGAGHFHAILR